ncbi:MAG: TrkH family potassium uptake protein [Sphingomonadales bacterium]
MIDPRPILLVLGTLLSGLGLAMFLPALIALSINSQDWQFFVFSAFITIFIGAGLAISNYDREGNLNLKQAFLMTTLVWLILPAFAAIPFVLSELSLSFTDAFFEAMSGLTTTGSTVITELDTAPPGILIWRSILQWLGGIGIIITAVAVLPMLHVGGMQLFRMESSDTSEKILPRAAQISGAISGLYFGLTLFCFIALLLAGVSPFDAIAHAMTTIATGGFSTSDNSIGQFDNALVDTIIIFGMISGSLPFVLYLQILRGKTLALWKDSQVRAFLGTLIIFVIAVNSWLIIYKDWSFYDALRYGTFNIISMMTGTGFSTTDFNTWGSFAVSVFFMVMFVGGCAGSTSCGVKIFRFQVLYQTIINQIRQVNQPNGIFHPKYNGNPLTPSVISSVTSFLFFFFTCFVILSLGVSATGVDMITATSGAGTALANVGPGLGNIIGPSGTFQPLPDLAKWLLAFGMLLGRLELFTVLVLFTPAFWRA